MKHDVKEKWLKALRSGEYEQGNGALNEDDKFCCLGVLCDIYANENRVEWTKVDAHAYALHGRSAFLPREVQRWAGFRSATPSVRYGTKRRQLIDLNDTDELPFSSIADAIEASL